jgi:hypothetical protein
MKREKLEARLERLERDFERRLRRVQALSILASRG